MRAWEERGPIIVGYIVFGLQGLISRLNIRVVHGGVAKNTDTTLKVHPGVMTRSWWLFYPPAPVIGRVPLLFSPRGGCPIISFRVEAMQKQNLFLSFIYCSVVSIRNGN